MFTFIAGMALAVNLGPMAPDAPAHEPQMAVQRIDGGSGLRRRKGDLLQHGPPTRARPSPRP